jgi:hypothetical protein
VLSAQLPPLIYIIQFDVVFEYEREGLLPKGVAVVGGLYAPPGVMLNILYPVAKATFPDAPEATGVAFKIPSLPKYLPDDSATIVTHVVGALAVAASIIKVPPRTLAS